ncbi:DUF192 domain-containing protein [Phaeobacter sp. QD34_3]|uniref:DUF192 domain-containing protein n=1 Tax=unclassified Phaeobacter TaxID=2621772 RepID=UPI00237EF06F|nr:MULTISPECIES: DUF192 domain-containing protein [unclassified Phaeobacter]MDE4131669.1 DUF192 domain-containing protein [Phaeobacter sp. QD34_3]MDE4135242.1 DUF192 domain-containing protein [Phaeobacter sp. QD34_24]
MLRWVAVWLLCTMAAPALAAQDCVRHRVDLRGDWGQAAFTVEIADTEQSRAQGLMFRDSLARGAGMLFVYERPARAAFWMKNTLIPLDILFLDETGRVTSVHANAIPHDETPIPGGDRVFAVLEINAGLAQRYGIGPGSEMRHEVFSNNTPVWPC